MAAPLAASAGAGASGPAYGDVEFDRVRDAVEDLGMDPTGGRPVNDALASVADGTLVRFPAGEYLFDPDRPGVRFEGGVVGLDGTGADVSFVLPGAYDDALIAGREMAGVYVGGIEIDQSATGADTGLSLDGQRVVLEAVGFRGRAGDEASLDAGAAAADDPTTIGIVADGTTASYELTVDGALTPAGRAPPRSDCSGANAEGAVGTEGVSYDVSGRVTDFRASEEAAVFVDGDRVDPSDVPTGAAPVPTKRLVLDAAADSAYELSVDGPISAAGRTASDDVAREVDGDAEDEYRFEDGLRRLEARGDVEVRFGPDGGN